MSNHLDVSTGVPGSSIELCVGVPETLHRSLMNYLENHPDWDQDRVMAAALATFLLHDVETMQRTRSPRRIARVYLDSVFG